MTEAIGGWRDRLIWESCHRALHDALEDLGWFNDLGNASKPIDPIVWSTKSLKDDEVIPPNFLVLSSEDTDGDSAEIGSSLTEDSVEMWLDFYPVNDALGRHLMGDVRDLLRGKMPTVGFSEAGLMVVDYRPASLSDTSGEDLFWVDIEGVAEVHNAGNPATPELRTWRSVTWRIVDERP